MGMDSPRPPPIRLWLDDVRPAPAGWAWAKTADEAIEWLKTGRVTEASLDHDLGLEDYAASGSIIGHYPSTVPAPSGKTGMDVLRWMAENNVWPTSVSVHSMNAGAAPFMRQFIAKHHPGGKSAP